jgi:hypothetical protein
MLGVVLFAAIYDLHIIQSTCLPAFLPAGLSAGVPWAAGCCHWAVGFCR